jgi:ATP-dependent Clp protease ATP-binding subunit ClpC
MKAIVELELRNVAARLEERELIFEFTDGCKDFLIEKGYDEKYGARPLRRAVERYLEDALAEAILSGDIKHGETIHVDLHPEGGALHFNQEQTVSG